MPYIGNEPAASFTSLAKQDITGNGGASYTLTYAVANANDIAVYVNNVRQEPSVAYTTSGTALTMTGNVASTDDFYVIYLGKALQTTTPPDGSVTSAKLDTNIAIDGDLTVDTSTLKVDSTNNRVGIGTASPSQALHVAGGNPVAVVESTTSSGSFIQFENTSSTNTNRLGYAVHDFVVDTNGSERIRIHDGGKLSINGSTAGSSHVTIYFESASYSALASQMTDNASGAGFLVCRKSDGSTIGQVARNGTADSVQFLTTSDYRLKENVSYDFDATTQLKQLRPCTFTWINDESNTTHQGFLAHEVQEIVPHAVNGTKDAVDENGNIEAQSIDKSDLVPLLVKTIQELEARITALENS